MLSIRPPSPLDLPPLYALAVDHKGKFLDDYSDFDADFARYVLALPGTLIMDDYGYAAGVAWFDDQVDDLRATMHLLVRPEAWRQVIKQGLLPAVVDSAFDTLGVAKILAEPMSSQKGAIKLLRKYKFYEHKPFYKHTKQGGIIVDTILFELRRKFWRQHGKR
jgi:RimJ/RimL family protein N-acetyltransferase